MRYALSTCNYEHHHHHHHVQYCGYYINGATPGVLGSPVGWSKVSPGGKMAFGPSFTGASSNTFQLDDGGVSQPGQDGGPSATVPAVKGRPDLNWSHYTPVGYRYHPIKGPYPQQNLFLTLVRGVLGVRPSH